MDRFDPMHQTMSEHADGIVDAPTDGWGVLGATLGWSTQG